MAANNPFYLVLHHSATPDNKYLSNFEAIRRYHMSFAIDGVIVDRATFYKEKLKNPKRYFKLPWIDIGYHYVLEFENNEVKIKAGRKIESVGSHVNQKMPDRTGSIISMNRQSIGVCVVGNFDLAGFNDKMLVKVIRLFGTLLVLYKIPIQNVIGHREVPGVIKSCPGKLIDMNNFRYKLNYYINHLMVP